MLVQPDQISSIASPKKGCQRGLEQHITGAHFGDKQLAKGGTASYMYFNNPIYRVGVEGDPAPGGLSSRSTFIHPSIRDTITLNDSPINLLYPQIDEKDIFISAKPWDQNWAYQRDTIPSDISSEDARESYNESMHDYNNEDTLQKIHNSQYRISVRELPVYDRSRIYNDQEPDGIHQKVNEYTNPGGYMPTSFTNNGANASGNRTIDTRFNEDNRVYPTSQNVSSFGGNPGSNREYYTNVGHYNYPYSDSYARMGDSYGYNRYSGNFTTSNPQGVWVKDSTANSGYVKIADSLYPNREYFQKVSVDDPNPHRMWMIFTVCVIGILLASTLLYRRKL
jgi:hypothetical protein